MQNIRQILKTPRTLYFLSAICLAGFLILWFTWQLGSSCSDPSSYFYSLLWPILIIVGIVGAVVFFFLAKILQPAAITSPENLATMRVTAAKLFRRGWISQVVALCVGLPLSIFLLATVTSVQETAALVITVLALIAVYNLSKWLFLAIRIANIEKQNGGTPQPTIGRSLVVFFLILFPQLYLGFGNAIVQSIDGLSYSYGYCSTR